MLLGGGDSAVRDNQPPKVENLRIQPSDLIASGTQVTVRATVTNDKSIREVLLKSPILTDKSRLL
ncbi:MAG: hypothetical protein NZ805_10565 [Armatimonadetes bacterium]|nr:hypothetical protein [Armatimonadota bacterium]MDW8026889.1 hypothetical protein [Armatimonadota bacterium]